MACPLGRLGFESIFHATSVICEIPSGMLADRFSYKTNLYLEPDSWDCVFDSYVSWQGNFWIYALAMVISAWSYNFDLGTSAAMVYDSSVEAGPRNVTRPSPVLCRGVLKRPGLWERSGLDFLSMDNCI